MFGKNRRYRYAARGLIVNSWMSLDGVVQAPSGIPPI
jgi:hypothetical protein